MVGSCFCVGKGLSLYVYGILVGRFGAGDHLSLILHVVLLLPFGHNEIV